MSAVCPACGVAVVPGYAKCPKCHKPLPGGGKRAVTTAGGTVAEDRQFPWMLIAVPLGTVIVIALLLKLVAGGGDDKPTAGSADTPVVAGDPIPQPNQPTSVQPVQPTRPDQPTQQAPDSNAATAELDRVLRSRRLWSTVEASPPRVDVRSGLCDDPGMRPAIDSAVPVLRGGGLTRLRCLAQSGTVVFERDL